MSYKIESTADFERELKKLAKKYPSVKNDYANLLKSLEGNPTQGVSLGKNCFKVRMAISSKNKGKSGGGRVITCVKVTKETVCLIAICDKSDMENLADTELTARLKSIT